MRYTIDTEFIDTPTCSALISLAIVDENLDSRYFEFDYPSNEITPWLADHVVKHLEGPPRVVTFPQAAAQILDFVNTRTKAEFWCYYGAYDWYWLCRIFGGFMGMPSWWPLHFRELADLTDHLVDFPDMAEHKAIDDAYATMLTLKKVLPK